MNEEDQKEYKSLMSKIKNGEKLDSDDLQDYYELIELDVCKELEEQKASLYNVKRIMRLVSLINFFKKESKQDVKALNSLYTEKVNESIINYDNLSSFLYACDEDFTNEDAVISTCSLEYCNSYSAKVQEAVYKYLNRTTRKEDITRFYTEIITLEHNLNDLDIDNSETIDRAKTKIISKFDKKKSK